MKHTQVLLFGMIDLLERVRTSGYRVYALTDNVIEIVDYLQSTYQLWDLFDGVIVAVEVGCLKPHADIFNHLLT
ncbi:HAD family hydrolase [Shewanella surugensis]|uniref:HAD family hydrolase n=1 Tax=Shewanella surugensis TaxID=212020 RepID=A0ABT0LIL6_9GAMM|nr:hypothetical protein [Shewanella surugensis]MCL1127529.1 hypothetical protein [Shewanella surugensis]